MNKVLMELLACCMPEGILERFNLTNWKKEEDCISFYMEEKEEQAEHRVPCRSIGFFPEIRLKDYDLKGKYAVYYVLKQRRWQEIESGKVFKTHLLFQHPDLPMTLDYALFLDSTTYKMEQQLKVHREDTVSVQS